MGVVTPSSARLLLVAIAVLLSSAGRGQAGPGDSLPEIAIDRDNIRITKSVRIKPGVYVVADTDGNGVLQIVADDIVVDFKGATLLSRKNVRDGDKEQYDGIGIAMNGRQKVVIKNATVQGYRFNLKAEGCRQFLIEGGDYGHSRAQRISRKGKPIDIFLDLRDVNAWRKYGSALWLEDCRKASVVDCRAGGSQNGICLVSCRGCTVHHNDFSFNSGWGIALWSSENNVVSWNHADFCNRPDKAQGGWGGDAAGITLVNSSHHNLIVGNSVTHAGFFLTDGANMGVRPSNDNVVAHNDGSWSAHNAFESTFSVRNVFYKNIANDSNYGFWLGYSSDNLVAENRIERNAKDGIAIGSGARNWIGKNSLLGNRQVAVHLYAEAGPDVVASRDSVVVDNVIKDSRLAVSLERSTGTVLAGNKLENAPLPKGVQAGGKVPPAPLLAKFLDSAEAKRVDEIMKKRPKVFKMVRDQPYKHGLHLLKLDDFAPRDFRPAAGTPADEVKKDLAALAGSWKGQSAVLNGKPAPREAAEKLRLEIADGKFNGMPFTIDPSAKPKALDLTYEKDGKKLVAKCIYELSGDTLRICRPFKNPSQRPTRFESVDGVNLMVWERSKK